jgi:NADH dehydrogenase
MAELAKKICILGGGFGGLYTALRLHELPWEEELKPEIILIDKSDRFLFSPLLYELITEEMQTWEIAPPYSELLAETEIKFIQAPVTKVDVTNRQVELAHHPSLTYDRLVMALGGSTPLDRVTGAKEYALPFRTLEDAYRLKEKLRALENSQPEKIRLAIVGGGYSGIELAVKIADRLGTRGKIRIIERGDDILRKSPNFNQKAAKKALEERKVWLDLETEVEAVEAESISLSYKGRVDKIPVDLVLWTVGTRASHLINNLSLPLTERGKLSTNDHLQVEAHPEIFALGDLAECYDREGKVLPANAQVAIQQADYCAWNIWASLTHKPLLPFRYQALGEMLALGVDKATVTALGVEFDGLGAYLARRLIYLYRLPTLRHQLSVGLNWVMSSVLSLLQ